MKRRRLVMKKMVCLIGGLACLAVAGFLTYGLRYVDVHLNWYLGFMSFAYLVGIVNLCFGVKEVYVEVHLTPKVSEVGKEIDK